MFRVGAAALRLGHSSWEGARAGAHFNGPIAGGPHVCVHTNSPVHIDGQARWTLTVEGALRVNAASVHADARRLALIDICTIASIWCQSKALFTDALKAAVFINAHAIETHVGGGTFIMIYAVFPIRAEVKASVADALEASVRVHTAAVTTHDSIYNTLINIDTGLFGGSALVTLVTFAVVRSLSVNTVPIHTGVTDTFIHIDTLPTHVLPVAHVTFAAVAGGGGDTAAVQTQIGEVLAHIDGGAVIPR